MFSFYFFKKQIKIKRTTTNLVAKTYESSGFRCENGFELNEWFSRGKLHHLTKPATLFYTLNGKFREIVWYNNGKIHRADGGPAVLYYYVSNSNIAALEWYICGKTCRFNGPARIWYYKNGLIKKKEWVIDNKIHHFQNYSDYIK